MMHTFGQGLYDLAFRIPGTVDSTIALVAFVAAASVLGSAAWVAWQIRRNKTVE